MRAAPRSCSASRRRAAASAASVRNAGVDRRDPRLRVGASRAERPRRRDRVAAASDRLEAARIGLGFRLKHGTAVMVARSDARPEALPESRSAASRSAASRSSCSRSALSPEALLESDASSADGSGVDGRVGTAVGVPAPRAPLPEVREVALGVAAGVGLEASSGASVAVGVEATGRVGVAAGTSVR